MKRSNRPPNVSLKFTNAVFTLKLGSPNLISLTRYGYNHSADIEHVKESTKIVLYFKYLYPERAYKYKMLELCRTFLGYLNGPRTWCNLKPGPGHIPAPQDAKETTLFTCDSKLRRVEIVDLFSYFKAYTLAPTNKRKIRLLKMII